MTKIDLDLMKKIKDLENENWKIKDVKAQEEYMGDYVYKNVVKIELIQRDKDGLQDKGSS